jgi:uncharacterized membrane protein YcaP (DUF421 family)
LADENIGMSVRGKWPGLAGTSVLKEDYMFQPSVAIPELIFRVVVVYAGVFLLLRVAGKRHVGELAPFDLVVLLSPSHRHGSLLLSECVQNALIGDDTSITGGLIAAATLFGLNQVVGNISWRSKRAERLLEGTPRVLVRHGHVLRDVLAEEQITHAELLEALRREGCSSLSKVRYAVLEPSGDISIGLRAERR